MTETTSRIIETVAANSKSIDVLTGIVKNLYKGMTMNGRLIESIDKNLQNVILYSTETTKVLANAVKTAIGAATENMDKIMELELWVNSLAEQVQDLSLFVMIALGLGVFNTVVLLTMAIGNIFRRK